MKTIFAILAMIVGISCFAEVYHQSEYYKLVKKYNKTKSAEDWEARIKYITETEFNTSYSDYSQVEKMYLTIVHKSKFTGAITEDAIVAEINKLYKLTDKNAIDAVVIRAANWKKAYDIIEKKLENGGMTIGNTNVAARYLSEYCFNQRDYDKAVKYANLVKPISNRIASILMRSYSTKGDFENAFKTGERLFLETYITSPAQAMSVMTDMMNRVPSSYDDAKLADFLEKVGKKYPAPGADFEAWKGFMGFVGYRYKALTGKDLFANSNK